MFSNKDYSECKPNNSILAGLSKVNPQRGSDANRAHYKQELCKSTRVISNHLKKNDFLMHSRAGTANHPEAVVFLLIHSWSKPFSSTYLEAAIQQLVQKG